MSSFTPPSQRPAWQALSGLAGTVPHLRELLQDPSREQFQASAAGLTLDYSHQAVDQRILQQLYALADESHVTSQAQAMFRGEPINLTEQRPVLHVALRGSHLTQAPWGDSISQQVRDELARFTTFAEQVRDGGLRGFTNAPITDVVNLGIGGSDLGPRMAVDVLSPWASMHAPTSVRVHFVSNLDPWSLYATLSALDPATTAFIVQSKSFTTPETVMLAASARRWLQDAGCPPALQSRHLVAVTARADLAQAAGYTPEHTFRLWDWVGGRYSLWSAIGLPVAIAIGGTAFKALLHGARTMDEHFLTAPTAHNLPMLLALLGVWNINFMGSTTHLVAPYAVSLARWPAYLQQLEMESNGKRTHLDGSAVQCQTAPVVWGGLGIEGQHAYFQLMHQGQHRIPVDFVGVRPDSTPLPLAPEQHREVYNNLHAQRLALAVGRDHPHTQQLLREQGLDETTATRMTPHRIYPGNTPSSVLWLDDMTPHHLGALVALYEHKVFCQAAVWGICAFDQWGVELGKTLLSNAKLPHAG
jgi:glucose-6-phosphate isomerase